MIKKKDSDKSKVIVAMSGGVDSSTAACLLKRQGYEVIGLFMRLGTANSGASEAAARAVCRQLKIKFYPVNLAAKFKLEIINYFLDSYAQGITPNPCVRCNKQIKFGELLRITKELGGDFLATGHYVRVKKYKLYRGIDKNKDQSYFLYTLTQDQLKNILFPLGKYTKEQVREIADKEKLPYIKKESQDVCFLNKDGKILEHNDYLKKYLKLTPGPIKPLIPVSLSPNPAKPHPGPLLGKERGILGEVIGEHQGLPLYTVGQRRGVEIGGTGPYYVAKTDYKTNTLYVAKDHDDPLLYSNSLIASEVNWIAGAEPKLPLKCEAVMRYRHLPVECSLAPALSLVRRGEARNLQSYPVKFKKPQRAITPGQSVVFYMDYEILGGGIISQK